MKDYSEYLNTHFAQTEKDWIENPHFHEKQAEVVNMVCKKYKLNSVLEIGCGTGNLAARLMGKNYLGIDSNEKAIETAETKNPLHSFAVGNVRELGKINPRELVCCFGFLKHFGLHEWEDIFKIISSLGKYFVFNIPIAEETKDDGTEFHHVWKSTDGINKSIYDAGLTLLEVIEDGVEPFFVCRKKD